MKKIKVVDTILRDAHQSLIATRLRTSDFEEILDLIDEVGYYAIEMWGGATYDSCLRYLDENPWDRLKLIKSKVKKTKLQMLLRGQNILGYKHYPDDVLDEFIKQAVGNGIDIIRIFDALNDSRNIERSIVRTKLEGGHAQAAISYTTSPFHNIDYYVKLAKEYESIGADSIAIKDMSGILTPYVCYELVSRLKKEVNVPIDLHSHMTSGVANLTYLKGVEAGVDMIDTALSPFAFGTSQPPTESFDIALKNSDYTLDLNVEALSILRKHFFNIRDKYVDSGLLNDKVLRVNIDAIKYQVPGGMLSNLLKQLKEMNRTELFDDVLKEVPNVRKDLGYPPLVTPMSQMVGTQALFNVITDKKYQIIPTEIKDYVCGKYGRSPSKINDELVKRMKAEGREFIEDRPAAYLKPELDNSKEVIKEYSSDILDVLSYSIFPSVTLDYLKKRG